MDQEGPPSSSLASARFRPTLGILSGSGRKRRCEMNLIPWKRKKEGSDLAHPTDLFRHQMNRLFDDFFGDGLLARGETGFDFVPRVDVSENDKEVLVKAELPGMDEKDVNVSLSGGQLLISGEKKDEREEKDKSYHLVERSYGSFSRAVDVGSVDEDKVKAAFKNGILTVTLPKREEDKARKIDIKTG
jgi:HSP20 family protein